MAANEVVQQEPFGAYLATRRAQFAAALPEHMPADRFMRMALTSYLVNPDLQRCEQRSLYNALMRCAQDGLWPDGREAALVVFRDKSRGPIATYMPMIGGLRKKARNSGEIVTWECYVVQENDFFDYALGDNPHIEHKPTLE